MARRQRKRGKVGGKGATLPLTSMMDILTVLLLFLLKSFVVEGEVITPVPGVELPESASETKPQATVVVAIFADNVLLDGRMVAKVSDTATDGSLMIPGLAAQLETTLNKKRAIAMRRGEVLDESPKVAIQGDREIPFEILQRVMFTCNQSGYRDISLAVLGAS